MVVFCGRLCLTALLAGCFLSFAWGMRYFFRHPANGSSGMKIIQACGTVFALLQLAAVLLYFQSLTAGIVAALLYVASLALFWSTIRANRAIPLSAAFLDDLPVHLNDRGPYRYIRHPFYTSYLLAWLAGVVAVRSLWLAPTAIVMLAIYWKASQTEENKFARSNLAASYAAYRARAGRFLPNPWKLAGSGSARWWLKNAPRLD